ncbi:MAG: hypothetical protein ABSC87_03515 [Halobacteriota archaeon]|jgi:hypothetical protein
MRLPVEVLLASKKRLGEKASDLCFSTFVRAMYDYFNPLLQAIEELQRDAKKNHKK